MIIVLSRENHTISFGGMDAWQEVMSDPEKVEAIKKVQAPQTKQELQFFKAL